jgi:hypothetical protein
MVGSNVYTLDQPDVRRTSTVKETDGQFRYQNSGSQVTDGRLTDESYAEEANGTATKFNGDKPASDVTFSSDNSSSDIADDKSKKKKENKPPMIGIFELVCSLLLLSSK